MDKPYEPPKQNGIWWLASYLKSGNTWMRMLLDSAVTRMPPDINFSFHFVGGDRLESFYQASSMQPLTGDDNMRVIWHRPAALLNYLSYNHPRDGCLKTHHANATVYDVVLFPPIVSKGCLYMIRDPRDVAVSTADHLGMSIDEAVRLMNTDTANVNPVADSLTRWYLGGWSTNVESWTGEANKIPTNVVRFEDLLARPHITFRLALGHLGLSDHISDDDVKRAVAYCEFSKLQAQEDADGFVEKGSNQERFFRQGKSGKWREILTQAQADRISNDHGDTMLKFGYNPNDNCVLQV